MKTYYGLFPTAFDMKLIAILNLAVEEERYEVAAQIRYEIDKRAAPGRLNKFIASIHQNQMLSD